MRVVLGIDPGVTSTGYGLIEGHGNSYKHICHGVIETDPSISSAERLLEIYEGVSKIVDEYKPSEAGVERIYFSKNAKTALPIGETKGVVLLCLAQRSIPCFEYTPSEVKKAILGRGRAEKKQIQAMIKIIFRLNSLPEPDHAADALATALCHLNRSHIAHYWRRENVQ